MLFPQLLKFSKIYEDYDLRVAKNFYLLFLLTSQKLYVLLGIIFYFICRQ